MSDMKNGLAVGPDGTKKWFQNDRLHRTDGPAIEYSDGTKEWYLFGKEYSENEHRWWSAVISADLEEIA